MCDGLFWLYICVQQACDDDARPSSTVFQKTSWTFSMVTFRRIIDFNNFWYEYFWHNWSLSDHSTFRLIQCPFLEKTENRTIKIWVEMNRNMSKSIPNIIDCDLKKIWQILIVFCADILDTTCHQITILVLTWPNACFCTTCENPKGEIG